MNPRFAARLVSRAFALAVVALATTAAAAPPLSHTDLFTSGRDGYHTFRIPAIEAAPDGSLIAFAEARKHTSSDPGWEGQDIDLVYRRSTDAGATWSPMKVLEDPGELWSAANPSTVVDRKTRRVWLFYIRSRPARSSLTARPGTDDMQTLARWSADGGQTWSEPIDVTPVARDMASPTWRASIPGPGGAIQSRSGRLIVPMWKFEPYGVFAIFSDDHGRTWARSEMVPGAQGGDECQTVELADGRILMDFRQNSGPNRWQAESADRGKTWGVPRAGATVTPVACAIERLGRPGKPRRGDRLVWTGPAAGARRHLVVRSSTDEGKTFAGERTIYDSFAAYSDLTILKDGSVGLIWERGIERSYQFLTFTRLDRKFLEGK